MTDRIVGLVVPVLLLCAAGVLVVVLLREGRRAHHRAERIARRTTTARLFTDAEIDTAWAHFNRDRDRLEDQ